jgi:hypothetical protein
MATDGSSNQRLAAAIGGGTQHSHDRRQLGICHGVRRASAAGPSAVTWTTAARQFDRFACVGLGLGCQPQPSGHVQRRGRLRAVGVQYPGLELTAAHGSNLGLLIGDLQGLEGVALHGGEFGLWMRAEAHRLLSVGDPAPFPVGSRGARTLTYSSRSAGDASGESTPRYLISHGSGCSPAAAPQWLTSATPAPSGSTVASSARSPEDHTIDNLVATSACPCRCSHGTLDGMPDRPVGIACGTCGTCGTCGPVAASCCAPADSARSWTTDRCGMYSLCAPHPPTRRPASRRSRGPGPACPG